MKMPFGKYKGIDIAVIPNNYIDWVLSVDAIGKRNPRLFKELEEEFATRKRSYVFIEEEKTEPEDVEWKF